MSSASPRSGRRQGRGGRDGALRRRGRLWWHSSFAGRYPARGDDRGRRARGAGGDRRDRWGVPHVARRRPPTSGSPRASATARTGCGSSRSTAASASGRVSEIAGARGAAGRPPDAHAGPAPRGRARGGGAGRRLRRRCSSATAPASTPPTRAPGAAGRVPAAAPRVRALAPGRHAGVGKLLAFGLSTNWERELLRADLVRELGAERAAQARPRLPGRATRSSPRGRGRGDGLRLAEQIGRVRGSIGLAAEASGSNNWAVSRHARRPARRCSPATRTCPRHARHLVRGRARARRPLRPRRLDPGPARRLWARTTTSPWPSPT